MIWGHTPFGHFLKYIKNRDMTKKSVTPKRLEKKNILFLKLNGNGNRRPIGDLIHLEVFEYQQFVEHRHRLRDWEGNHVVSPVQRNVEPLQSNRRSDSQATEIDRKHHSPVETNSSVAEVKMKYLILKFLYMLVTGRISPSTLKRFYHLVTACARWLLSTFQANQTGLPGSVVPFPVFPNYLFAFAHLLSFVRHF